MSFRRIMQCLTSLLCTRSIVARFLDVRAGLMKGNTHCEARLIKMALKSSAHGKCSCVSPDAFGHLSSKELQGLEILHQKEGLITEQECGRIGRIRYYGKYEAVAQIILAKSISESLKFCEIFEQYQLLGRDDMKQIKVFVDVYHKEQLLTKEEAEGAASDEGWWKWRWGKVAAIKDLNSATRIADILAKYGFSDVAQHIRVLVDVYHKEQLVTKEEAENVASDELRWQWRWGKVAVTNNTSTATRIADILDKYGLNDVARHIRVLVDVYHKEQLVTTEEAEKAASDGWRWIKLVVTKDGATATRIADILDNYGFHNVAQHIRERAFTNHDLVLANVYHKEQLVTKDEAEKVASNQQMWVEVALTKDGVTVTRIADILDKYGFNNVAQRIRVLVDIYHKEQLVTKEEAEGIASYDIEWRWEWIHIAVTKDARSATRIADILDMYGFSDVAQHLRGMTTKGYKAERFERHPATVTFPQPTKLSHTHSHSLDPTSEQYATSDTSVLDTSISKTSPDIGSNEPRSQEKATVTSELDTASKKELYVGELNVIEEVQRNFWTRTLKTFVSLFHDMSYEAVLSRNCWLPFGYHSITVDRRGGTYNLCSDGLTKLTVPRNAVRGETAEIRYAIIGKGPFQLPPNYQLGSFVVYVHYNPEEITTPVTLSLPTWYGGDVVPGEPPPDGLSFAVAPHTLGLWDTQYTFQLVDGGKFTSISGSVAIEGHSSLFAVVFKEGATCSYFATKMEYEPLSDGWVDSITVYVVLSFASHLWTKIIEEYWGSSNVGVEHLTTFHFRDESQLEAYIAEDSTSVVALSGARQITEEGITYDYHSIRTAAQLKNAVKGKRYPPKMVFNIYSIQREAPLSPVANKLVHFGINGANVDICMNKNVLISQPVNQDPSSSNPPTPSMYNPVFGSGPFMDSFKEEFLRVVAAKDIAENLKTEGVIPESVYRHIVNQQTTDNDANLKLFRHLHQHGAPFIIQLLCDIMIQERGYPNMNTLGRAMSEHTSLPPP